MTKQELLERSWQALQNARLRPANEQLQQLIDAGVIDENGKVISWDADFGIIAVKSVDDSRRFAYFRCLKSTPNMPGLGEVDLSRDALVGYLREKKKITTAYLNEKQQRWRNGKEIHLTIKGYLRTDESDVEEDNLGELPQFSIVRNGR